jgi:glycerol kinase
LLENSARVREANKNGTLKFGTIDSWLVHRLTNGARHVTDVTNASRTMLMDLRTTRWRKDTCDAFQVNVESLPEILSSADDFGTIALGYLRGVKLTAALGDQHAATLGQRCRPGEAKCTYGTGCFMFLNTGRHVVTSEHGLLTTVAWRLKPGSNPKRAHGDSDSSEDAPRYAPNCLYALEGSVAIAGAGVQWLRDNLGIIRSTSDVEPLAGSVDDAAGVVFVPAFTGLFAPRWKQDARGVIVGLTQHSTAAHIARALLDAICFQVKDVLDAMIADVCRRPGESGYVENSDQLKSTASFSVPNVLRVDGGATANALLMQTQADVLGMEISRPRDVETTALGAALAAGIGAGLWSEEDVFAREGDFERVGDGDGGADETATTTFEPRTTAEERAKRFALWCEAVGKSFGLARE